MHRASRLAAAAAIAALLAACSGGAGSNSLPSTTSQSSTVRLAGPVANSASAANVARVCAAPAAGYAACHAIIRTDVTGSATTNPSGYHPADLRGAYSLPSTTAGSGQAVGIVDAYNDPHALSDVNTYRSTFGIAQISACNASTIAASTNAPCFLQISQSGSTSSLPTNNASWSQEISLDLDMVSAVCPSCSIILAEASSASLTNLGTAVNAAAKAGATEISNSYGGSESSSDTSSYDGAYFNHPGIAITVSSGDSGYGVEYPAASQYVTAVGGTTLHINGAGGTSPTYAGETLWETTSSEGAGSGCSAYDPQPSWQSSVANITGVCAKRAVADVSADADPNTGVSVYDSYSYRGQSGWLVFGGTSVASPIIASVYALAGNASSVTYGSYPYSHTSSLHDVTANGAYTETCGNALCLAEVGWDGPSGLGSPSGTGAF
jgi:subtilase family serine protease